MLSLSLIAAAPLLATPAAPPAAVAADTFAIRASHVHIGDGSVLTDAVLVIEGGKIKSIGLEAPKGVRVTEVAGHIAPGFIALRESIGAGRENSETARKSTPNVDLSYAYDPEHPAWKLLVANGVTTVVLTPASSRIAGGQSVIVSPALGEIVKRGATLSLGMSSRTLSATIEPTSYAGLYANLNAAFESAAEGSSFAKARAGELPVMLEAVSRAEVVRAAAFAAKHGLKGAIVGAPRADETIDAIKASGLGVVFEPISPGSSNHVVDSVIALQNAGIPFAFTTDGQPARMRMTVAACTRGGLDPGAALSALTSSAAALAGIGATHGTLAAGRSADFVVWSGDPTDLTSRVHAVYAGGELVHHAIVEGAGH